MTIKYCFLSDHEILPYQHLDYVDSPKTNTTHPIHQACKEPSMKRSPLPGYTFTCEKKYGLPHCTFVKV